MNIFRSLLLTLLLALPIAAQDVAVNNLQFYPYTVGSLPSAGSNSGRLFEVTDGINNQDCSVGHGMTTVLCQSNGTVYWPLGIAQLNWSQSPSGTLTAGQTSAVTLTPCPNGIDTTSGVGYQVYLSGGGNSEAVNVITEGGDCTSGASSGTIHITPVNSYSAGYTISSASAGIQEQLNVSCGVSGTYYQNGQCNVVIPANGPGYPTHVSNTYVINGTIFLHASNATVRGDGVQLDCRERGPCLQIGDLLNSNHAVDNTIIGFSFAYQGSTNMDSNASYAGVAISSVSISTISSVQTATINTATAHGFQVGDMVTQLFTDDVCYWGDAQITAVPSTTSYQYTHANCSTQGSVASPISTPGVVALTWVAVLDNGLNTEFDYLSYATFGNSNGQFNNFFDFWDDENATVSHFGSSPHNLNHNLNWTGSFFFSGGAENVPTSGHQLAAVITVRDSTITANGSNCVTDFNSNGVYFQNTVCQATGIWQMNISDATGNFGSGSIANIYSESSLSENGSTSSPYPSLGVAGFIDGPRSTPIAIKGKTFYGAIPTGGTGSTPYTYYVVANDTTAGTQTAPMQILNWESTGSDTIPVSWPRYAYSTDTITYDVIRMTTTGATRTSYPYTGGCSGRSGGTCGYVTQGESGAYGISQSSACGITLVCTLPTADNGGNSTVAHSGTAANYPLIGNVIHSPVFWPGSLVTLGGGVQVEQEESPVVIVGGFGNFAQIGPVCTGYGASSGGGGYTACITSITNANVNNQTATILSDGPTGTTPSDYAVVKGRLLFEQIPGTDQWAHHYITLKDCQPGLAQATPRYRPLASACDTWFGTDITSLTGSATTGAFAMGAHDSISAYIANTGDGSSWLERLTASKKEFNVPVQFDQSVTGTTSGNPVMYEAGVATSSEKMYSNTQALTAGAATHPFASSFTFTSSSTFLCQCTDQTAANACKAVPASATTVTLAGTSTDTLALLCTGH